MGLHSTVVTPLCFVAGEDSKRLVGMQIPALAVDTVLDKLEMQSGYKHVRQQKESGSPSYGGQALQHQPSASAATANNYSANIWQHGNSSTSPIELD